MSVLEEAESHLAGYGALHVECCGTPIIRKLVAELRRLETPEREYIPHVIDDRDETRTCIRCGLKGNELQISCQE